MDEERPPLYEVNQGGNFRPSYYLQLLSCHYLPLWFLPPREMSDKNQETKFCAFFSV